MQTLTPNPTQASAVLERIIRNAPFIHGSTEHPQFLNAAQVTVGTEYNRKGTNNIPTGETLVITTTDPHITISPKAVSDFILTQLAKIPELAAHVEFETPKNHLQHLKETLENFIGKGAPIPKEMLEWSGFKGENNYSAQPHAARINKGDGGISVTIEIPKESGTSTDQVAANIQSRMATIKNTLAERTVKYSVLTDDASKAALTAKINALDFAVSQSQGDYYASVTIDIRSPEQLAALKAPGGILQNQQALAQTNPLMKLSDTDANPQLQKALARSILHAGQEDGKILAAVLGVKDVKQVLIKGLKALEKQKPELAAEINSFLNDDMFKRDDWNKPEVAPTKGDIHIVKEIKDTNALHINLQLPPDFSAAQAIASINALDPTLSHTSAVPNPPPPSADPLSFAQVDSVQLVGANSPEAQKIAQDVLAKFNTTAHIASPASPVPDTNCVCDVAPTLTPFAEKLIQCVEDAHQAIQGAYVKAATPTMPPTLPMPQVQVQSLSQSHGPMLAA